MLLDIDVGNTRAKWRLILPNDHIVYGACAGNSVDELIAALHSSLQSEQAREGVLSRIRIAAVRSREYIASLSERLKIEFSVDAEFAQSSSFACGVRNSYANPDKMGVDRWCAVIAAVKLHAQQGFSGGCCIVDAGSALTLDFVNEASEHLGGYITPGYHMQVRSLFGGTEKVDIENAINPASIAFGRDTNSAVHAGIIASMLALIESSTVKFSANIKGDVTLYITGGDAGKLLEVTHLPMIHKPYLVLEGLNYLLE